MVESTAPIAPRFSRRVRALWIDTAVALAVLLVWIVSLDALLEFHPAIRLGALVVPLLLLEPVLVAWTGGSIGHHVLGLRVRDADRDTRLGLLRACLRALLKGLLGWLSLAFAIFAQRGQALHDTWTRSVVVLRAPERVSPSEIHVPSAEPATPSHVGVSVARRLAVIVAWWVAATAVLLLALGILVAGFCDAEARCSSAVEAIAAVANFVWMMIMASIPALGWFGRLYGARSPRA